MSDLLDIILGIDTSQIKTAKQEMAELANSFNSAQKSASVFEQAFAKAAAQSARDAKFLSDRIKLNQDLVNANLKVSNSYKSASESASAFTEIFANQDKQAKEFTNTLNRLSGVTGKLATDGGASFSALNGELERLSLKYDSAYAATKLYEAISKELNMAILNEIGDVDILKQRLDDLNNQYNKIGSSSKNTAEAFIRQQQATNGLGVGVSRAGVLIQQAGYQFGDFLVQVQSGTNAFVAFGQQATQMVGFMSPVWEGLGLTALRAAGLTTALSIVIPLVTALGAAWMRTSKDTKEAADTIESHIKSLQSTVDQAHLENIKIGFKVDQDSVAQVKEDMIKAQMDLARLAKQSLDIPATAAYGGSQFGSGAIIANAALDAQKAAQQEIIDNGQKILDQLSAEREARRMLAGQSSAAAAVQARIVFDKAEELRLAKEQADSQQKAADKANYLKNVFHALAGEAGSVSMYLGNWPKLLDQAANAARNINFGRLQVLNQGMMGRSGSQGQGIQTDFRDYSLKGWQDKLPKTGGSSGGGGGSGAASSLIDSLMTQQEQVDKWYEESQKALQSASDKELAIIGGKQAAIERLEEEHQKRLSEIKNAYQQQQISDVGGFFGSLANIAEAGGKRSAKAAATFQAIEGTVNAYGAAIKALNTPGITLAGRFAAYASVLAAGLKGVAAIRSAGGVGGGVGSVGTSSVATEAAPQQVMIQGLKPTDIFTGQQLSDLFDSLYKENRNRGMVFMVQR